MFVLSLMAGVAAFGIAPPSTLEPVDTEVIQRELALTGLRRLDDRAGTFWREERVQRGDTIGSILARLAVDDPSAMQFLRSAEHARALRQLRPGKSVRAEVDDNGGLLALRYVTAAGEHFTVERDGSGFRANLAAPVTEARLAMRSAEIRSSLFGASDAVGLPDAVTMQLAEIFSGDIDFLKDLRRGDRFSVVYEVLHVDGEPLRSGRVVAAEFLSRGTTYRAFLFTTAEGASGYYTDDGRSMRKAFLRSPMEFSRITSGYSLSRFNPIIQTWTAHRGIDYGAPTGTAVRATGDGRITYAGWKNGYGNVVMIQHWGGYSTLYAHLSKFAQHARIGEKVGQGDVIGQVGATGWATGPHLHYEFRVNNEQRDPLRIDLPTAEPIAATDRPAFATVRAPLAERLGLVRGQIVAAAE